MTVRLLRKKLDAVHAKNGTRTRTGPREGARVDRIAMGADSALRLLGDIRSKRLDAGDISADQRRACLMLLANGKQTSAEMAVMFKVSPSCIRQDLQVLRKALGREVQEWSLEDVLGQLYMAKEKCAAEAMKNEDPGLAWTVERDWAKMLKELGVIGPREDRSGLRLTVEAIGTGMDRAVNLLSRRLDPILTGEVVGLDATDDDQPTTITVPALPLRSSLSGQLVPDPAMDEDCTDDDLDCMDSAMDEDVDLD